MPQFYCTTKLEINTHTVYLMVSGYHTLWTLATPGLQGYHARIAAPVKIHALLKGHHSADLVPLST